MRGASIMDYQFIETNGIHLHVGQDGPSDGQLVILLHGFPEFSYGWKRQIPYLSSAGYRVWAPDQRGYNLSDKPDGIAAYTLDILADDVIGLIKAAGQEKAFLVGHDWGAAVAWWVATKYPDRIARMIVMNVPHGLVLQRHLRRNIKQLCRSWYIFFFQLPWLPERLARLRNWNMPTQSLKNSSRPGTFTQNDLDIYRQAWSQPKAYRSMLNWYRALIQKPPTLPANPRITVPTLLIWGAQDRFLGRELAQPSIDLCDDGRLIFIEEATHWVQHEEAEQVNELIAIFLSNGMKD
ncbi:alpha/beta fold hydrolase [Nitrosomonas communis]|uniref:alpha/beta fold hydrolase n=1 Tax=Nitrosomonas communis TaxID=44574 RepID=UPI0026EBFCCF|nr:alpha/beta hydrolase [Nitrosomonas communis]